MAIFNTAVAGDYVEVGRYMCASHLSSNTHPIPGPLLSLSALAAWFLCHLFQHCSTTTISGMGRCLFNQQNATVQHENPNLVPQHPCRRQALWHLSVTTVSAAESLEFIGQPA